MCYILFNLLYTNGQLDCSNLWNKRYHYNVYSYTIIFWYTWEKALNEKLDQRVYLFLILKGFAKLPLSETVLHYCSHFYQLDLQLPLGNDINAVCYQTNLFLSNQLIKKYLIFICICANIRKILFFLRLRAICWHFFFLFGKQFTCFAHYFSGELGVLWWAISKLYRVINIYMYVHI